MNSSQLESSLERLLRTVSPQTAEILDRALCGKEITVDEATRLFDAEGSDLLAMIAAADDLRARTVGDVVTYVINRNINFTNVCVKACGFCAFSRGHLGRGRLLSTHRRNYPACTRSARIGRQRSLRASRSRAWHGWLALCQSLPRVERSASGSAYSWVFSRRSALRFHADWRQCS